MMAPWIVATHPVFLFGVIPWPRIWFVMGPKSPMRDRLHDALGTVHIWFGYALYVVLALHVLGALKHQFWDREPEIQRMLP